MGIGGVGGLTQFSFIEVRQEFSIGSVVVGTVECPVFFQVPSDVFQDVPGGALGMGDDLLQQAADFKGMAVGLIVCQVTTGDGGAG